MALNTKVNLLTVALLLLTTSMIAQNQDDDDAQYIISGDVSITKYHDRKELKEMQKGKLLLRSN